MDYEWGFGRPSSNSNDIIHVRPRIILRRSSGSRRSDLGLAIASHTLTPDTEPITEAPGTNYELAEGLHIERPGIDGRSVYYLLRGGERVGIRKVAKATDERAGQFEATQNELRVYNVLSRHAKFNEYIVPFLHGKENRAFAYLDFALIPGSTFAALELSHTRAYPLLARVAAALKWLTSVGYTHGDIKHDNVYVTTEGKVLLMDFGNARPLTLISAHNDRAAFIRFATAYVSKARADALHQLERASPIGSDQTQFYTDVIKILRYTKRKTRKGRK